MNLYLKLIRFDKSTGYLLLFFPSSFGLCLGAANSHFYNINFLLLVKFFIASIIIRSAGCIINDIFDRDFDKYVSRTKDRPLAEGSLNLKQAFTFLLILLFISLLILLSLNKIAIYLGFIAFIMIILYPLMKRITNLAQVFLGMTFNLGSLIGYGAVKGSLDAKACILYIGCCFWTIGYDTIYGFMDIEDDKKLELKSLPMLLVNRNYKIYLFIFYSIFIICFSFATLHRTNDLLIYLASIFLIYQVYYLDISKNCIKMFKANNYIGFILLCSFLV